MDQLNAVLQTRATARGLIVNMSGVLFKNGKATLLPEAREKLAKIAGHPVDPQGPEDRGGRLHGQHRQRGLQPAPV